MAHEFYALLGRMRYITRWGLMRNSFSENIQEHSYQVAVLSHALALIRREVLGMEGPDPDRCAVAALYHDASEILTGDMPTPVKYYNEDIKSAYKKIEATAELQLTEMLPEDFKADFHKIYNPDPETRRLVKAADKISALIKCIEELNMGNKEFEVANNSTLKSIKNMNCTEADIFLKEFIPSFYLSLDEQREIKH